MASSSSECVADLPAEGREACPSSCQSHSKLEFRIWWPHGGSEGREGRGRSACPLGPGPEAGKEGLAPHVSLSPRPQVLQAAPALPGPPLLAHSLWAGMQAHTSRRSRERGLGQTQGLRSRSNVAVQQVLGTRSGHGRLMAAAHPPGHTCIHIDVNPSPHAGALNPDPTQGP